MKKRKARQGQTKEKSFFVPKTISSVAPKMTLECADRYELLIGGCKNIDEYSEKQAKIRTSSCTVRVCGSALLISFLGDGKIFLSGKISSIEFI